MHTPDPTLGLMDRFTTAINAHNLDAVLALVTDDIVFESTSPPPDGTRYQGRAAVAQAWGELLASAPKARFAVEEQFSDGAEPPWCAGATTGARGTCAAWTSSGSETAASPKAWPTSRDNATAHRPSTPLSPSTQKAVRNPSPACPPASAAGVKPSQNRRLVSSDHGPRTSNSATRPAIGCSARSRHLHGNGQHRHCPVQRG